MLILTRRIGEALKIGDDIEVTVLSIKGNQIRLGIKVMGIAVADSVERIATPQNL